MIRATKEGIENIIQQQQQKAARIEGQNYRRTK